MSGFERRWIVGFEVVAVGTMKDVNVPKGGVVALLDDLEGLVISGGNERAAGFAFVKEFLFGDFARFGVVRDENDLDVLITGAEKLIEQEKETAREVFLHRIHGAGGIHDAEHDRVGFRAGIGNGMMIAQIVLMKGKAPAMRQHRAGCCFSAAFLRLIRERAVRFLSKRTRMPLRRKPFWRKSRSISIWRSRLRSMSGSSRSSNIISTSSSRLTSVS